MGIKGCTWVYMGTKGNTLVYRGIQGSTRVYRFHRGIYVVRAGIRYNLNTL